MRRLSLVGALALAFAACAGGPARPAPLDTKNEACGFCRMAVSDARFAAQLVAPSEEPKFFDDIGCFAGYLKAAGANLPPGAIGYVADHRTKAFVPAASAAYTRVDALATPMGSHLIAHADAASRDADAEARGGKPATVAEIFGASGLPDGGK
jgi:copper chaperone NosL